MVNVAHLFACNHESAIFAIAQEHRVVRSADKNFAIGQVLHNNLNAWSSISTYRNVICVILRMYVVNMSYIWSIKTAKTNAGCGIVFHRIRMIHQLNLAKYLQRLIMSATIQRDATLAQSAGQPHSVLGSSW